MQTLLMVCGGLALATLLLGGMIIIVHELVEKATYRRLARDVVRLSVEKVIVLRDVNRLRLLQASADPVGLDRLDPTLRPRIEAIINEDNARIIADHELEKARHK